MKCKRVKIRLSDIYILIFNILVMAVFDRGGQTKYIIGAGIVAVLLLIKGKNMIHPRFLYMILPYLFYIILGEFLCIINGSINKYCFEQPILYLLPFFTALIVYIYFEDDIERFIRLQFIAIMFIFLRDGIRGYSASDLMESKYAFIFGAYLIYFSYKKHFIYEIVDLVLLYLAHKRIAMLGAIAVWAFFKIYNLLFKRKNIKPVMMCFALFAMAMFIYLYLIRNGILNEYVYKFGINTMGRTNVYDEVAAIYTLSPLYSGSGIGTVRVFLNDLGLSDFNLMHNDLLSIYIETGFWGFIIFWIIYWGVVKHNGKYVQAQNIIIIVCLLMYTFINFMTDNISIYICYLFPFYFMIFELLTHKKESEENLCA